MSQVCHDGTVFCHMAVILTKPKNFGVNMSCHDS